MTRAADYFYSYDITSNVKLIESICSNLIHKKSMLKNLVLVGIQFRESTMDLLSEALTVNLNLERIQLSFCLFSESVIRAIHPGLGSAKNLKEVDLSNNGL